MSETKAHQAQRLTPNKDSKILKKAIIAGAGLGLPPSVSIPDGMGAVLLFVPIELLGNKSIIEIQQDIGLPWHAENGSGYWFYD